MMKIKAKLNIKCGKTCDQEYQEWFRKVKSKMCGMDDNKLADLFLQAVAEYDEKTQKIGFVV